MTPFFDSLGMTNERSLRINLSQLNTVSAISLGFISGALHLYK